MGFLKCSIVLILLVNFAERFCFYTINGTQVFYMKNSLDFGQGEANAIILVLQTACYLSCFPGGILGDKIGRFWTILGFAVIYLCGTICISASVDPHIRSAPFFLLGSFGGLALGSGGIKPNVPNFGADQLDDPEDSSSFFSYFYWMVNIGSAIALGFMSTVTTSPTDFGLPKGWGYFAAYSIAAGSMFTAAMLFLSGKSTYKGLGGAASESLMRPLMRSVWHSAKTSCRARAAVAGWILMVPFFILTFVQAFTGGVATACLSCVLGFSMLFLLTWAHLNNDWLHLAPEVASLDNGLTVQQSRQTFQGIPMLIISNVVFNFAYSMMLAPFVQQSCQMNLAIGSTQLSGAVFNLGDCFAIILFIPLFDKFIYKWIATCKGSEVTNREKLMAGFFFAALSMVSAILLEVLRRNAAIISPGGHLSPHEFSKTALHAPWGCTDHNRFHDASLCNAPGGALMGQCVVDGVDYCSKCAPGNDHNSYNEQYGIYESDISGLWMFIPFALIGIGEILVNPTTYYYAYTLTPPKTRSVVQAVNMVFQGALPPALVSVFTVILATTASPSNLNNGHCEYLYYIAIVFCIVGAFIFVQVANRADRRLQIPTPDADDAAFARPLNTDSFSIAAETRSFGGGMPHVGSQTRLIDTESSTGNQVAPVAN